MRGLRITFVLLLSMGLVSFSGCIFKKKKPPVPPQAQAPTTPAPAPAAPAPEPTPVETEPPAPPSEPEKKKKAAKPKRRPKVAKKPAPTPAPAPAAPAPPSTESEKTGRLVIQEGGASQQGQLAAGIGLHEAAHERRSTEQLLESTQANLNSIRRRLTRDEEAMVSQIKDYMEQCRKATAESDLVRAHNLALKAHLLSNELAKR